MKAAFGKLLARRRAAKAQRPRFKLLAVLDAFDRPHDLAPF